MKRLIGIIIAALIIAVGVRTAIDEDSRRRNARADEEHARQLAERTAEREAQRPPPKPGRLALPFAMHSLVDLPAEELTIPSEPWPIRELTRDGVLMDTFTGKLAAEERTAAKTTLVVSAGTFATEDQPMNRRDEIRVHPEVVVLDGSPDVRRLVAKREGNEWRYGFLYESSFFSQDAPKAKWVYQTTDGTKGTLACWTLALRPGQRSETIVASWPEGATTWWYYWGAEPIDLWINGHKFEVKNSEENKDARIKAMDSVISRGKGARISIEVYLHADATADEAKEARDAYPFVFGFKK